MKQVILALSLISSFALAETATITVDGMHCSSCKKMMTKSVCESEAVKKSSESCEVKLVDEDKQIGEVVIVSKKDMKVDVEAVKAGIKNAGDDYKLGKINVSEEMTKDLKTETAGTMKAEETMTKTAEAKITKEEKVKKTKKTAKKMKEMKPATETKGGMMDSKTEAKKETK